MIIEIVVLALASTVRPTSLAAVYALVSHGSRRLMWAYVGAGLAFTFMFGVTVVGVSHGIHLQAGSDRTKAIAEIVGGAAALIFGAAIVTGRVGGRQNHDAPRIRGRWQDRLEQRLTIRTAAIAGPLTHIPGIFYLIALNIIVAQNPWFPGGALAVLAYDVVWFALPIYVLVLSSIRPGAARATIAAVLQWTGRHSGAVLLATCFLVGPALIIHGVLTL